MKDEGKVRYCLVGGTLFVDDGFMGISKPTEMTIQDLLQEELRKRGVTVVPEFSVSTPTGRLMPDMLLKDDARYVEETKLG